MEILEKGCGQQPVIKKWGVIERSEGMAELAKFLGDFPGVGVGETSDFGGEVVSFQRYLQMRGHSILCDGDGNIVMYRGKTNFRWALSHISNNGELTIYFW